MGKIKAITPNPDSTNPVRAAGWMTALVSLVVTELGVRYLSWEPDFALRAGTLFGPIFAAEIGRRFAYAPATVARLLAVQGTGDRR